MKHQIFFYLVASILLSFCNNKLSSEMPNKLNYAEKQTTPLNEIIGEWTIIYTVSYKDSTSTKIMCYSCPKVNFNNDGSATLVKPSKEKEIFKWKVKNDTIYITYTLETKERTFRDNKYFIKLEAKKEFDELELIDITKSQTYILRRE